MNAKMQGMLLEHEPGSKRGYIMFKERASSFFKLVTKVVQNSRQRVVVPKLMQVDY